MNYKEWEDRFIKTLKPLDSSERERLAEYYREMYEEKLSEGKSEEVVLEEFGSPESSAYRILAENYEEKEVEKVNEEKPKINFSVRDKSFEYIGLALLSLLLIIPIAGAMLGVIVAFGSVSVSGVAVSVAGVVGILALPFLGAGNVTALLGFLIASIGVGILLFIGFYYLTKYTAIICYKCLNAIYKRSKLWKW